MGFKSDFCEVKIYRYNKDGLFAETLGEMEYTRESNTISELKTLKVPAGFKTNFASVPQVFHSLIAPLGKHSQASILHDYLYSKDCIYSLTRKQADLIFYEAMCSSLVHPFTARLMYCAVRAFGFAFYKK